MQERTDAITNEVLEPITILFVRSWSLPQLVRKHVAEIRKIYVMYFTVCILFYVTEQNLIFFHSLQIHCHMYHSSFPLLHSNIWNVLQYYFAWDSGVVLSKPEGNADRTRNVYCQQGKCLEMNIKANSHIPCHSPATLIHTCHAAPLPFSDSAVSFVKVRVVDGNILNASLLLVTIFVEIRVVAERRRTWAGNPHAVSGQPMLIHTYHAVPMPLPCCAVPWPWELAFRTAWSWQGVRTAMARRGMCESNTAALCKSNRKDTILIGTAWERYGMCELALMRPGLSKVNWSRGQAFHAVSVHSDMLYDINCPISKCVANFNYRK
jgi:hypothetical protein